MAASKDKTCFLQHKIPDIYKLNTWSCWWMNVLDIKGLNIIYLGVSSRFFYKFVLNHVVVIAVVNLAVFVADN